MSGLNVLDDIKAIKTCEKEKTDLGTLMLNFQSLEFDGNICIKQIENNCPFYKEYAEGIKQSEEYSPDLITCPKIKDYIQYQKMIKEIEKRENPFISFFEQ